MVESMRASFRSFAIGLILSVALLYLILVAQFRSFVDPAIILLAFPPGLSGVLVTLWATGTTLNVMSLMGIMMLAGIAMSNSILIVEFAHHLVEEGATVAEAIARSCRVRLRPVLMTSLATLIGLLPVALKLGEDSESYAPLARALLGGLAASVACTIFIVPAAFVMVYRNRSLVPQSGVESSAMNKRHIVAVFVIVGMRAISSQAAQSPAPPAIVPGNLRQFAIAAEQPSAREALHRAGWVEADGRLFRQQDLPELYAQIGRAYTRAKTSKEFFAVPYLVDRRNDPNPYGVLGPADLISSGLPAPLPPAPTYFIYVGKDVRSVDARWK
jgi:hypothetical protein